MGRRGQHRPESPGLFVQNSLSSAGAAAIPGDSDKWGVLGAVLNEALGKACVCTVVN